MLEAAAATALSILSDRLSLNYPLLPCQFTSAQNEEENRRKKKTSLAFTNELSSGETQLNEVTIPESSSDPSPTLEQEDNECDSKENKATQTIDDTYQHRCIKDVRKFDRTVVLVLFCLKFIVFFTFAVIFGSADDSAVDIIQCLDEYYFP